VSAMEASQQADGSRVLSYEEKLALYKKQRELSLERDAVVAISFLLNETYAPDESVSEAIADGEILNEVASAMNPNKVGFEGSVGREEHEPPCWFFVVADIRLPVDPSACAYLLCFLWCWRWCW
jgi:hypothetical protein